MIRGARSASAAAMSALAALLTAIGPIAATPAAQAAPSGTDSVAIAVESVTPTAPAASKKARPLTVTLTVTNRTAKPINGVRIEGERAEPISTQDALDAVLRPDTRPTGHIVEVPATRPVIVDLPPGAVQDVTFRTTTGVNRDASLCICHAAAVYPLFFSAHVEGAGGVDQQLGVTSTFVPAFGTKPAPMHVSWVWPLIDRPHRLTAGNVFTDDLLTSSVAPDGRLSRALAVAEAVGATVPLTLVIDPELLDELSVMASGSYRVSAGNGRTTPGLGRDVAQAWLDRLRTLLTNDTDVQVQLTPYADPDVEALSQRDLRWTAVLPAAMRVHVEQTLAGRPAESTLAWPAGGALSSRTLHTLVADGVSTVLLNSTDVNPRPAPSAVRPGLARMSVDGQDVAVGLLTPSLQKYVAAGTAFGGAGLRVLPDLIAELAVRAVQEDDAEHVAVLAAPRYVDPSVAAAVSLIRDTSRSTFAEPIALRDAVGGPLLPTGRSRLATAPASASALPAANLDAAAQVVRDLPAIRSLLATGKPPAVGAAARALLDALPGQAQRASSSAWAQASLASTAREMAGAVTGQLDTLTHGVRIIQPSSGSYTLATDNSPLPITVENDLDYPVAGVVRADAVNGLLGFTARPTTVEVGAHQKAIIHLPTSITRPGRIRVEASLWTPNGVRLGNSVPMTVRSTALGLIGLIITIGAGAVLVLALLIRVGRQLHRREPRTRTPRGPRWDPDAPNAPADPAVLVARGEASQ